MNNNPNWSELSKMLIKIIQLDISNHSTNLNVNYSEKQIGLELFALKKLLNDFPEGKTFMIEDIQYAMEERQFVLLKNSSYLLVQACDMLKRHQLLPGKFIRETGIYHTTENKAVKTMETAEIDNLACKGLTSVDKKEIVTSYVFNSGKCPFCNQPTRIEDFITVNLSESIKGGISLQIIGPFEEVSLHKIV